MTTDPLHHASDEVQTATEAVVSDSRAALNESLANAERRIAEMARRAERVFNEVMQNLRSQSRVYAGTANEQFDQAQKYVVERVKARPVTATLAGVGLGLLLGLLLSSREK